jgi:hypothetical protein
LEDYNAVCIRDGKLPEYSPHATNRKFRRQAGFPGNLDGGRKVRFTAYFPAIYSFCTMARERFPNLAARTCFTTMVRTPGYDPFQLLIIIRSTFELNETTINPGGTFEIYDFNLLTIN